MAGTNTNEETAQFKTLSTSMVNRFQPRSAWMWSAVLIAISLVGVIGTSAVPGLETGVAWASASSVQVSSGDNHTCILEAGSVKCWGSNSDGQLGLGDRASRGDGAGEMGDDLLAVDLGTGVTATTLATGHKHTCVVTSVGAVKCWGDGSSGQLSYGDTADRGDGADEMGDNLLAVDLGSGVTATAIATGAYHTCALTSVGAVKCWGYNFDGELGLGDTEDRGDGAGEMGNSLPAVDLGTGVTATAIATGEYHTCALTSVGVKCWGYNDYSQLGLGDTASRGDGAGEMGDNLPAVDLGSGVTATAIATGGYHTCALTSVGVKCWGSNSDGELGLGDTADRGDGDGEMGDSLPAVNLGSGVTATAIATGAYHTCALTSVAAVKCWGYNRSGQLGFGDTASRGDGADEMGNSLPAVDLGSGVTATAIAAGGGHTCALTSVGVKCWGYNGFGQLGLGDTADRGDRSFGLMEDLVASDLGPGVTATAIATGVSHTCALTSVGVKCWGYNLSGELGLGDVAHRGDGAGEMGNSLPAVNLGSGVTATAIATGAYHSCALTSVGVKCWGYNVWGHLGLGNAATLTSPSSSAIDLGSGVTATAIAAGGNHTCALTSVGVKCWGYNVFGQLGLGITTSHLTSPSSSAIDLGSGVTATAIAAGADHTCALTSVGAVKCWGYNHNGQLGLGDLGARGDGADEMGNFLPAVDLGSGVTATAIAAGADHTCALTSVGVKCWGYNGFGQLGLGDTTSRNSPSSSAIDLGSGVTATAIETSRFHTCVSTSVGAVKCWGRNSVGQLGLGDTTSRNSPSSSSIDLGSGVTATAIATGDFYTCALTSVGATKCWGGNEYGQLGLGSNLYFGGEETQMGNSLPVSYAVRALSTPSTPVVMTPVVTTPVVTTPAVTMPAVNAVPRATIRTSRIPGNGHLVKISKFPSARITSAVGMKVSTSSISLALARPSVAPKLRPASYSISLIPLNGKKYSMRTLIPDAAKNLTSTVFGNLPSGRYEVVVVARDVDGRQIGRWKSPQIRVVNGMSNKK